MSREIPPQKKTNFPLGIRTQPHNARFLGRLSHVSAPKQVNSALHSSGVAKSSTSFGWGKGGNVTSAGWQVTLCDPMWRVSSRSGVATLRTAIHLLLTYLLKRHFDRSIRLRAAPCRDRRTDKRTHTQTHATTERR